MTVGEILALLEQYPADKPVEFAFTDPHDPNTLVLFDVGGVMFDKTRLIIVEHESYQGIYGQGKASLKAGTAKALHPKPSLKSEECGVEEPGIELI